ncbi:MAG: hypothetical protein ABI693_19765 [Bryobacteraceae bacterium]
MRLAIVSVVLAAAMLSSCAKKDVAETPQPATETPVAATPASGPHAVVHLNDGSKVPGTIVASTQTDMTVAGDDGIERKIPLTQVKSVQYGESRKTELASRPKQPATDQPSQPASNESPLPPTAPPPPVMTTRTYELPAGSDVSVRTNEAINSGTASEGQTFDAEVTRDARDSNGDVVIPRGSGARIVIKSASKGGRFRGSSDLVLDWQSVIIGGREYSIDAADISQKGKSGVGVNKRTAKYGGGGAALGAIIGAIAGGGKGAAIGAGAGAGAGVLTEVLTKGGSIKVPAESVLTFSLDKPLRVRAAQ